MNRTSVYSSNIKHNNKISVALLAGGFGLLGSVASFMVSFSALFIIILFVFGKISVFAPPDVRRIAFLFLVYFLAGCTLAAIHYDPQASLQVFVMRLAFLGFLPLVSAFALTAPSQLRHSIEVGASAGAILTAAYAAYEITYLHERAWGAADNPGPFAVVMSVMYSACILGCIRPKFNNGTLLRIAGAAAAAFCILASGMRALLPMLIFAPAVAAWTNFRLSGHISWKSVIGVSMFAFVVLAALSSGFVSKRLSQIETDISQIQQNNSYNTSLGQRIIIWDYAWQKIPESPWLGFGEKKSAEDLAEFSKNEYGIDIFKSHFHNIVATSLMRGGILELIATIALLFGPVMFAFGRRFEPMSRYGVGLMVCLTLTYLCSGLLNIGFGHDIMDHVFIFMMAVSCAITFNDDLVEGR